MRTSTNGLFNCEGMTLSRRSFLKASAILSFAALPSLSWGKTTTDVRLLTILLRGGMDGMHALPPVGDPGFAALRRNVNPDDALKLDSFFAMHPSFKTVQNMYAKGEALLVGASSIPYTGRSHFEGQNVMESGVMTPYASETGWMGRALDLLGYHSIAMSLPLPLILRGKADPDNFYPSWMEPVPPDIYKQLLPLWDDDLSLAPYGQQVGSELMAGDQPQPMGLPGGKNSLESLARAAARRFNEPDGPRMAVLDHVGFDTHSRENSQNSDRFREVDDAIAGFRSVIHDDVWKNTLVVTVTEFGRTAAENGSQGTDHGYGTAIFVLGGRLKKAGIVADWPGLKTKNLFEGRDLLATIDARSLYGAIMSNVLNIDPEQVRRDVIEHTPTSLFDAYL